MTCKYLIKVFIFIVCYNLHFSNFIYADEIKIESVIILDENIPKECGIKFMINEKKKKNIIVSIKKKSNDSVYDLYALNKELDMENINLRTQSFNFQKDIKNRNEISSFFQELLIGGGKLIVGNKDYKILGPINSKVRLEYLFCTGEMYHPKYER